MIREVFDRAYDKGIGVLKGIFGSVSGPVRGRGGLIQVLYIIGLGALMAGFISAVDFPIANQGIVIYPGGGAEAIPEAVIDAFVILLGAGGIYLAFQSGRQTTNPRNVNLYLGVALLLIATSVLAGIQLAILKGYG